MSIKPTKNGRWRARLTFPTARKDSNGAQIHKEVTKTFDTKGAASAWVRTTRHQFKCTGTEVALTLTEIFEYREAKRLADGRDLREAARFWALRNPNTEVSTVAEAVEAYYNSKEWKRMAETTVSRRKSMLKQFIGKFGDVPILAVTRETVEEYTDAIPVTVTRNNHIRVLRTFFKWCRDGGRRFLTHSPTETLRPEPEHHGTPKFLALEDVERILKQAIETDTGIIPYLVLGFFAGIRPYEIPRLERRDIHLEEQRINVRAEVAKRKRLGKPLPRVLEGLPDTLWRWLDAVDFNGEIDCKNYVSRRRAIYEAAGVEWHNSAARHTFSTYSYAMLQDAGRARKWTGHRGNDTIFLTHYAALETKVRGEKYFQILPPTAKITPVRLQSPSQNRTNWPEESLLLRMAKEMPKVRIAALLGVSEAAVRKKLQKIG